MSAFLAPFKAALRRGFLRWAPCGNARTEQGSTLRAMARIGLPLLT